jgi:methylthioribulose-1-phosphate dehydratase
MGFTEAGHSGPLPAPERAIANSIPPSLDAAVETIIAVGRRLDARQLAPATSGNYSVRLSDGRIAVTVSGRHKGRLRPDDVMVVSADGVALEDKKPSAETGLHTQLYRRYPQINAILHVHTVPVVTLTRYLPEAAAIVLQDYEMLKALPGITTHQAVVAIPVFENSQDIPALSREVDRRLDARASAYLIRGHGAYGWGKDMDEAERVIEALEHLLSCEIEALRLRNGVQA